MQSCCAQCFNTYKAVRGTAVGAVMSACKRYPCLAPLGAHHCHQSHSQAAPADGGGPQTPGCAARMQGQWAPDALQAEVFARRGLPSLPAPTAQSAAGRLRFQNCSRYLKSCAGPVQQPELKCCIYHLE